MTSLLNIGATIYNYPIFGLDTSGAPVLDFATTLTSDFFSSAGYGTFARNSIATFTSGEGLLSDVKAGQSRHPGSRLVTNILQDAHTWPLNSPNDMTGASRRDADISYSDGVSTLTATSSDVSYVYLSKDGTSDLHALGSTYIVSARVKGVGSSVGKKIGLYFGLVGYDDEYTVITLTDDWQRVSTTITKYNNAYTYTKFDLNKLVGTIGDNESIQVKNIQFEDASSKKNKTVSEYVENYQYFETKNGNGRNLLSSPEDFGTSWINNWSGGTTLTLNDALAPNGTTTADKHELVDAITDGNTSENVSLLANSEYTVSMYMKNDDAVVSGLSIYNSTQGHTAIKMTWATNTPTQSAGSPTNIEATDEGDGWYRVSFTFTATQTATYQVVAFPEYSIATTGLGAWFWGGNLSESDELGAYCSGNIVSENVGASLSTLEGWMYEDERENTCLYSENFVHSTWDKTNTTITANSTASPRGSLTGTELADNSTTGAHAVEQESIIVNTDFHILSAYFKKGTSDYATIYAVNSSGDGLGVVFNLNNGTIDTASVQIGGTDGGVINIVGYIKDAKNGWWRCEVYILPINAVTVGYGVAETGSIEYSGSGDTVYLFGTQVEEGEIRATSYIPTVDVPITRVRETLSFNYKPPTLDGSMLVTWKPIVHCGTEGYGYNILSNGNTDARWLEIFNATLRGYDGTTAINWSTTIVLDTEYSIGLTYEPSTRKVYLDGSLVTTGSLDADGFDQNAVLVLGEVSGLDQAHGIIKNIKFYKGAHTQAYMESVT